MFAGREKWGGIAVLAAVVLMLASGTTTVAQQDTGSSADSFTASETRRLAAGELVQRRTTQRRGQAQMIGGTAWQVVDQPAEVTWRALRDVNAYNRLLPATEDARVVWHRPGQRVVRIRHAMGLVRIQYHLRMTYDHDRRDIAFRLDRQRPNDLRAAWGFLNVRAYNASTTRSLVSYGVMADTGGGMLGGVIRGQIHDWLLRVPQTVRRYLHGSGAHRY